MLCVCNNKLYRNPKAVRNYTTFYCGGCRSEYLKKNYNPAFIGASAKARRGKTIKITSICRYCKKEFKTYEKLKRTWCSRKCYVNDDKPNYMTPEIGRKISRTKKGQKSPWVAERNRKEEYKLYGDKNPARQLGVGKKISEKTSGCLHHNWQGGLTPIRERIRNSIKYKTWRKAVFERDNYTCQTCHKRGCYIEAHHIKSFSKHKELRFVVSNGITLCQKCHNSTKKGRGT